MPTKVIVRPNIGQVIVELPPVVKQTQSGIFLAEASQSQINDQGIVVAIGDNVRGIAAGDRVYFKAHSMHLLNMKQLEQDKIWVVVAKEDVLVVEQLTEVEE